ncbi:MAG: SAM-dependent chlorinase/fluorinase [Verrucomicrobiota bacterium]
MRRFIFILFTLFLVNGCSEKKQMNAGQGLIVLLTDFGLQDSYVGEMKGVILSSAPEARLVDLTHEIEPFNIKRGAVVLTGASAMFPSKTIFLGVVDPGVGGSRNPILLLTQQGKYYVGPDNGLFSLVAEREGVERIWTLDKVKYYRNGLPASTFHGRDIFAPVAAALSRGEDPSTMGTPQKKLESLQMIQAKIVGSSISGEVLYVDRYGNVVTNIPASFATPLKMGALVKVTLTGSSFSAPYVETYSKVTSGRALMLKNSQGLLEISVNQGSASKMYNIKAGSPISLQP